MTVDKTNQFFCCSLVIPTKNGGPLFCRVVRALQNQTCWNETEFIVVDSGSSDDTIEVARGAGAKVIQIAPEEFNHGATRDLGISIASSEFVILMVQDALPNDEQLIEALLKSLKEDGVAGVYARQIPQPDADILTKRNLDGWLTGRMERDVREMASLEWYQSLSPMEKYFFCNFDNVCSAIRKSVWEIENFGSINFGEDIDWAERVLKHGYKIIYEPSAAVVHSHDRPITYEYKRTYVCHRKLYRQFSLHLVPSLKSLFISWFHFILHDIKYILSQKGNYLKKILLLFKVPILNLLSAWAQYRAVRDESSEKQMKVRGV